MSEAIAQECALNNAVWHDTVCRSHGVPGEFQKAAWINLGLIPAYYANAVTLVAEAVEEQLTAARLILEARSNDAVGFKDSFSRLDLGPLGFRALFRAHWIVGPPAETRTPVAGVSFTPIADETSLREWEAAWGETPATGTPVYRPSLLDDANVKVIGARRGGRIVAGVIANRTSRVVGLTNLFVRDLDPDKVRRGLVDAASRAFPGIPLVGYERGDALDAMRRLGFRRLDPLTVWVRAPGGRPA